MWNVLYVEDEENDTIFMRRAFAKAGLEDSLKIVADGQNAIDYLAARSSFANRQDYVVPSLVLLDLHLPAVSGFQVLKWIRERPNFQSLPVVIFSSSARMEDRLRAKQLGASDYLEKPNSGLDFGSVLETLRQKWGAPLAQALCARSSDSLAATPQRNPV